LKKGELIERSAEEYKVTSVPQKDEGRSPYASEVQKYDTRFLQQ
jgi:hypothetical protein